MTDPPTGWTGPDDLDVWTVDRLLDGAGDAFDVPAEYQAVTDLIGVIKEGVAPAESGWGSKTVPAMSQLLTAPPREHRRKASRSRSHLRRMPQLAAAVTVVACLGAGSAAAATGSLPHDVQTAVDSAASMLGVSLPNATSGGDADSTSVTTPTSPPVPAAGVSGRGPSAVATVPQGIVNPSRTRRTEVGIGSGVLTARPLPTVTTSTLPSSPAAGANPEAAPGTQSVPATTPSDPAVTTTIPPAADPSTPPTTTPSATGKGVGNGRGGQGGPRHLAPQG